MSRLRKPLLPHSHLPSEYKRTCLYPDCKTPIKVTPYGSNLSKYYCSRHAVVVRLKRKAEAAARREAIVNKTVRDKIAWLENLAATESAEDISINKEDYGLICLYTECTKFKVARGLCSRHYARERRADRLHLYPRFAISDISDILSDTTGVKKKDGVRLLSKRDVGVIRSMLNSGKTQRQVAHIFGVSVNTVKRALVSY